MPDYSLYGESLSLNQGKTYFFIDALYIERVRKMADKISPANIYESVNCNMPPYASAPLARYSSGREEFPIKGIKKFDDDKYWDGENFNIPFDNTLPCDTGLMLAIEDTCFLQVLETFSYDDLVEAIADDNAKDYWREYTRQFPPNTVCFILAPGVDSGYDFDGGGSYQISG